MTVPKETAGTILGTVFGTTEYAPHGVKVGFWANRSKIRKSGTVWNDSGSFFGTIFGTAKNRHFLPFFIDVLDLLNIFGWKIVVYSEKSSNFAFAKCEALDRAEQTWWL
ncbi:MAG: hypothetical protein IKX94_09535 [Muribaculaceae bacterium]|nr:hypothetical protein [Muribaculaceae bacterium]